MRLIQKVKKMMERMSKKMRISENGLNFIKSFEGCDLVAKKYKGEQYYTIRISDIMELMLRLVKQLHNKKLIIC